MFYSEILASLNFNNNKMLSLGLENNHTLICCSVNFPTIFCMSRLLEKYQINIWMHSSSPIQETRSRFLFKVRDRFNRVFFTIFCCTYFQCITLFCNVLRIFPMYYNLAYNLNTSVLWYLCTSHHHILANPVEMPFGGRKPPVRDREKKGSPL